MNKVNPEEDKSTKEVEEILDRQEIVDLISIRQYVANATGNPAIDKATVNYLSHSLIMVDRKIIGLLQSTAFKKYINYNDISKAIKEVRAITDIKSAMKK